jgi:hypothetical protein
MLQGLTSTQVYTGRSRFHNQWEILAADFGEKRCFGVLLEPNWGERDPVLEMRVLVHVEALYKQTDTGSIEMSLDLSFSMLDSYIRSCDTNQTL